MKAVSVSQIKKELEHCSTEELTELCLRLSKFKKENKELLTYLLFESHDEAGYIETVKAQVDEQFELINTNSYFYIKKSVRKILRTIKKFARYSLKKETEVELLLHFCHKLKTFRPSITNNATLTNIYNRQLTLIKKIVSTLHEDLQYDFHLKIDELGELRC
ncbi:MAG TPA: hypothetical protein VGA80_06395 [Flavobacteriaceae bacterium]